MSSIPTIIEEDTDEDEDDQPDELMRNLTDAELDAQRAKKKANMMEENFNVIRDRLQRTEAENARLKHARSTKLRRTKSRRKQKKAFGQDKIDKKDEAVPKGPAAAAAAATPAGTTSPSGKALPKQVVELTTFKGKNITKKGGLGKLRRHRSKRAKSKAKAKAVWD